MHGWTEINTATENELADKFDAGLLDARDSLASICSFGSQKNQWK